MCGIAGIFNLGNALSPRREELTSMMEKLNHRGPDGRGLYVEGPVGLAHTRLSIIDLAGGEQPIHNEDRSVWVTFNGEIFNYVELRAELLAQGHHFYTQSDTEVIVHLYEQHGTKFVDYLNGQFAIALWDNRQNKLILARDRTGIRPLFYTTTNQRLLFASEVKALFALPEVRREMDPLALNDICTYWSPLSPRSIFKDVSSLPPGHIMVVTNGKIDIEPYWDWAFPDSDCYNTNRCESDYADELRALMIDAVKLQLRADVPVGAYLSGGLDSSIITSLIHHFSPTKLRTFSLTFDDAEFDERVHQQELVNYLGTDHSSLNCTRADIAEAFPRTILHTETPIVRTAPTPLMLLSGHVRSSGYKVVLTGEGADEVFGGYDLFKEAKARRFWARQPESTMRPRILERLYPYLKHSPMAGRAFTENFFRDGLEHINEPFFAHIPRWTTTRRTSQFFSSHLLEQIGEGDPYAAIRATMPSASGRWAPMSRDQYVEAHTLMTGYLLCSQGDRVAMANSIEGRFPFLDHRVIEFANRLPPKLKMRGLVEKFILKKSMTGLLPESVRTRTKQPYRAPDSASFFEKGRAVEYVADLLNANNIASAGYFNPVAVGKLFEKCRAGRAIGFSDNMSFVAILSTMLVHEQLINGRTISPTTA
jgi:asparagine synthase (glutamine-hydrolysing)